MSDKGWLSMFKQAQDMQSKLAEIQEGLADKTVEVSTGGGMVKVVANGINEIIEDGLNGFLSEGINYGDITRVIYRAFALSNSYIQNEGVHLINNKFSLESIVEKERMIFNKYAV